uniref:Uncharacterized protein n=1 Tax=Arundo donax TaxID=35708 RepID=A0A0A9ECC4_ARUDO
MFQLLTTHMTNNLKMICHLKENQQEANMKTTFLEPEQQPGLQNQVTIMEWSVLASFIPHFK